MNKRPGHVKVTTEVAFCSFCARPRTLRVEERQLGTLVRTITTCETCHRTLSSTVGVAGAEPAAEETAEAKAPAAEIPAESTKTIGPAKTGAAAKSTPKAAAAKPKAPATRGKSRSK
jgi:hypothetical protein